ncbi:MAG TPA: M48 family metalloprotease, partial [Thermoanaerobaculia bacterium]|nr:M48 family metalloprotease [Thermoanaerobaculia bacterium]
MKRFRSLFVTLILACALVPLSCATNPATGKQQLSLIGEQQEIAMGRDADKQVEAELGLYDDPKAAALVERIGKQLAKKSERPDLPWTFRIVDDPAVNAFALPGGFIYVTRGIL